MNPTILPLKRDDILEVYGEPFRNSVRGVTVWGDNKIIAMAGVLSTNPPQCFSNISNEMKKYPRVIVVAIREIRKILNNTPRDVYALASEDEETANQLLRYVGFSIDEYGRHVWTL